VRLFTPPFDHSADDPGYVRAYPPGVRENGGQYTHAAVWVVAALLELGKTQLAKSVLDDLLPTSHSRDASMVQRYRVEPYVLVADIYSTAPHAGRGGWSWYTGSAGWMHRLGWEWILGVHLDRGAWRFDPRVPKEWQHFEISLRRGDTVYAIRVENPEGVDHGVKRVVFDGEPRQEALIKPVDDHQTHHIEITLGSGVNHLAYSDSV